MKDRYAFLRTTEMDGKIVALMGDREILGDSMVTSLRQAFAAHASPISRSGVMTMTADQLRERLPELEKHAMPESVAAYKRAIECIDKKTGHKPESTERPTNSGQQSGHTESDPATSRKRVVRGS
jgi:hypothetical protein